MGMSRRAGQAGEAGRADPLKTYDAIVVGSGITGGWAAKELTEAGKRVALLEEGPPFTPDEF